jgi:hypothetical protein
MRQLLQQYRRRIPHEYQQLKLRRLGIIKYANGNLRYKPVKLFRHDHCGHPGSAPRGAEIRDEVHKQHRQQQRRKRGDGDHRLLFPVIGIRSIRVYHLRKQQRSQQTGAVFVLQRRKQQGQIQSQRDKHSRFLVGNSKVKYNHSATSTAVFWWLRSPYASFSTNFVYVYTDGTVYVNNAFYSIGFAPGFCV